MKFNKILSQLRQDIGANTQELNDRQPCYLRFNQHTIVIEHSTIDECLYVYTSFPAQYRENQEQYFQSLLSANHFSQGSGNGWLSYNPDTQETYLMTQIQNPALSYDDFVLCLEGFLGSIERSKQFIEKAEQGPFQQNRNMKNPFV